MILFKTRPPMRAGIRNFLQNLLNILYPRHCIICREALNIDSIENFLCRKCWNGIKKNVPLKDRLYKEKDYYFDRAYAACAYEGAVKELIHQFKYNGKNYLRSLLGRLLTEHLIDNGLAMENFDYIIPIPLHKRKLREREFNQASLLAKEVAGKFNLRLLDNGLMRVRDTANQAELPKEKRLKNVKDCFIANPKLAWEGKNILIVDDLLTTGSTCSQAALALKNAGCNRIIALTLAN